MPLLDKLVILYKYILIVYKGMYLYSVTYRLQYNNIYILPMILYTKMVNKLISLKPIHIEWLKKNSVSLSKFVQNKIDSRIRVDKEMKDLKEKMYPNKPT